MSDAISIDAVPQIVTFGCRLNTLDSEAMRDAVAASGRDVVVLNTCAVTGEAVRQARQAIRRIARARPGIRIAVTGCGAQAVPDQFAAMPEVTHVLGNALKADPAALTHALAPGAPRVQVAEMNAETPLAARGAIGEHRTRAFVQVQSGCDHRCTFCIIPRGRGDSRSAAPDAVVARVRQLVAADVREVVLTGVDLTSYAVPSLGHLVLRLLREIPELPRLRLSSLDCIEMDGDLLRAFAGQPRLMPHVHLSLQAGDDLILKRMKRRHLRADAIALCKKLRDLRPDIVFGADFITGFPTEDEAAFARSLDLVEACGLTHLHVFPFSARAGTPAERMPQVDRACARARAARLREAGSRSVLRHLEQQIGRRISVLTERGGQGRAEDFTPVRMPGAGAGQIIEVTVAFHDGGMLIPA